MATITTRASKGSPLSNSEMDANLTNLRYSGKTTKNKLVNGDFTLARNAGPVALPASTPAISTLDNWLMCQNTSSAGISAQVTASLTGYDKALKMGRNSGSSATGEIITIQALSTTDSIPMAGKSVVLSFYAKSGANFSGIGINTYLVSSTGTDQSAATIGVWSNPTSVIQSTPQITTTWTRYSLMGKVPSTCTQLGLRFFYTPTGTAGADDNVFITGVQLEEGEVASDREIVPYSITSILSRPRPVTCGRLSNLITQTGPTPGQDPFDSCHFIPYNGNLIMVNGKLEVIPDGALAASGGIIARYSNCYVDKVAGQSLSNNTLYFVYVFMNSGVPTITFSTTGYTQNGATWGNAVKSNDETCTLVGICYIQNVSGTPCTRGSASKQTISSYFNQFRASLFEGIGGSTTNNTATALSTGYLEWVQWYDNAPKLRAVCNVQNSLAGNRVGFGIGFNTTTAITLFAAETRVPYANSNAFLASQEMGSDATGYNYAQAMGYEKEDAGAGTASFDGLIFADGVMV